MKLATKPQSGQPALEHALDVLAQLVLARHTPRTLDAVNDAELIELAQAALWETVDRALQQDPRISALFPSLQRLPNTRREELASDVHSLQRALEHWRSGPRTRHAEQLKHDDELGLFLTTAAHAEGFHALASWICGADALDELEAVLSALLAQVGVLTPAPISTQDRDLLAKLVADSRTQWSGPAPRRSPLPAPSTPINTEPGSPLAKASRAAATLRAPKSGVREVPERDRRLLLSATLAALVLLTLGVVSWAQNRNSARPVAKAPASASVNRGDAPLGAPAPQQHVRVYSRPTRAELYLDGRFIGFTPLELERSEATGLLRLSLAGYPDIEEHIDLRGSRNAVLVFELGQDGAPTTR